MTPPPLPFINSSSSIINTASELYNPFSNQEVTGRYRQYFDEEVLTFREQYYYISNFFLQHSHKLSPSASFSTSSSDQLPPITISIKNSNNDDIQVTEMGEKNRILSIASELFFQIPTPHSIQLSCWHSLLNNRDVFLRLPTSGGKSLIYQLYGQLRKKISFIITPLISLGEDQVAILTNLGYPAISLSGMSENAAANAMIGGQYAYIFLTPERLQQPTTNVGKGVWDIIKSLYDNDQIGLFVIDEAHCIVQWGFDFRPEYSQLGQLKKSFPLVQLIAMTATATLESTQTILTSLSIQSTADVYIEPCNRPNIAYMTQKRESGDDLNCILYYFKELFLKKYRSEVCLGHLFDPNYICPTLLHQYRFITAFTSWFEEVCVYVETFGESFVFDPERFIIDGECDRADDSSDDDDDNDDDDIDEDITISTDTKNGKEHADTRATKISKKNDKISKRNEKNSQKNIDPTLSTTMPRSTLLQTFWQNPDREQVNLYRTSLLRYYRNKDAWEEDSQYYTYRYLIKTAPIFTPPINNCPCCIKHGSHLVYAAFTSHTEQLQTALMRENPMKVLLTRKYATTIKGRYSLKASLARGIESDDQFAFQIYARLPFSALPEDYKRIQSAFTRIERERKQQRIMEKKRLDEIEKATQMVLLEPDTLTKRPHTAILNINPRGPPLPPQTQARTQQVQQSQQGLSLRSKTTSTTLSHSSTHSDQSTIAGRLPPPPLPTGRSLVGMRPPPPPPPPGRGVPPPMIGRPGPPPPPSSVSGRTKPIVSHAGGSLKAKSGQMKNRNDDGNSSDDQSHHQSKKQQFNNTNLQTDLQMVALDKDQLVSQPASVKKSSLYAKSKGKVERRTSSDDGDGDNDDDDFPDAGARFTSPYKPYNPYKEVISPYKTNDSINDFQLNEDDKIPMLEGYNYTEECSLMNNTNDNESTTMSNIHNQNGLVVASYDSNLDSFFGMSDDDDDAKTNSPDNIPLPPPPIPPIPPHPKSSLYQHPQTETLQRRTSTVPVLDLSYLAKPSESLSTANNQISLLSSLSSPGASLNAQLLSTSSSSSSGSFDSYQSSLSRAKTLLQLPISPQSSSLEITHVNLNKTMTFNNNIDDQDNDNLDNNNDDNKNPRNNSLKLLKPSIRILTHALESINPNNTKFLSIPAVFSPSEMSTMSTFTPKVAFYHGSVAPGQRARIHHDFIAQKYDILVATIAFGMGINVSFVQSVVHWGVPKGLNNYHQEAGRGGRGGAVATRVLVNGGNNKNDQTMVPFGDRSNVAKWYQNRSSEAKSDDKKQGDNDNNDFYNLKKNDSGSSDNSTSNDENGEEEEDDDDQGVFKNSKSRKVIRYPNALSVVFYHSRDFTNQKMLLTSDRNQDVVQNGLKELELMNKTLTSAVCKRRIFDANFGSIPTTLTTSNPSNPTKLIKFDSGFKSFKPDDYNIKMLKNKYLNCTNLPSFDPNLPQVDLPFYSHPLPCRLTASDLVRLQVNRKFSLVDSDVSLVQYCYGDDPNNLPLNPYEVLCESCDQCLFYKDNVIKTYLLHVKRVKGSLDPDNQTLLNELLSPNNSTNHSSTSTTMDIVGTTTSNDKVFNLEQYVEGQIREYVRSQGVFYAPHDSTTIKPRTTDPKDFPLLNITKPLYAFLKVVGLSPMMGSSGIIRILRGTGEGASNKTQQKRDLELKKYVGFFDSATSFCMSMETRNLKTVSFWEAIHAFAKNEGFVSSRVQQFHDTPGNKRFFASTYVSLALSAKGQKFINDLEGYLNGLSYYIPIISGRPDYRNCDDNQKENDDNDNNDNTKDTIPLEWTPMDQNAMLTQFNFSCGNSTNRNTTNLIPIGRIKKLPRCDKIRVERVKIIVTPLTFKSMSFLPLQRWQFLHDQISSSHLFSRSTQQTTQLGLIFPYNTDFNRFKPQYIIDSGATITTTTITNNNNTNSFPFTPYLLNSTSTPQHIYSSQYTTFSSTIEIPIEIREKVYYMAFEDVSIPSHLTQWADLLSGTSGAESEHTAVTLTAKGERWGHSQAIDYYTESMQVLEDKVNKFKSFIAKFSDDFKFP